MNLIPTKVHAVLMNGTDGYPVVEAEVIEIRQKPSRTHRGMDTVVVAKATKSNHRFERNLDDELFAGARIYIDMLDAVEESGKQCAAMVERTKRERAEWNAMSNAEQCASMGYGVGRYTGD